MKNWKRLLCCFFVLFLLMSTSASEIWAASVPGMNAAVTKKNVMALLNAYDKDGAYLLKKTASDGSFLSWWYSGESIVDSLDTAVHEQCHEYMGGLGTLRVYTGNKKTINVKYTDIFHSKLMADSIPESCRTFRYSTYVADPVPYLASDIHGVYGLLNEFTAYSWGLKNTVSLYSYYAKYSWTMDTWSSFINNGVNDRMAYAEFNYYILHYLYYAKKNYPKIYKGIMKNTNFRKAYRTIEKKFRKNITVFEKDLQKIIKKVKASGGSAYIRGGYFFINGRGVAVYSEDYETLTREVQKSKYQKIYKALQK